MRIYVSFDCELIAEEDQIYEVVAQNPYFKKACKEAGLEDSLDTWDTIEAQEQEYSEFMDDWIFQHCQLFSNTAFSTGYFVPINSLLTKPIINDTIYSTGR